MYKDFFKLTDYPFNSTPDPRFLVLTQNYNELLASLYYGIEMAKGLIVLTGEVGTGKTTALRWIIKRLDSTVLAAYIFNPRLSIEEFYHSISESFDLHEWANKSGLLAELGKLLEDRHRRGLRTILIVDEAHYLSDEVLEEIRLLMNFESDTAKYLQIILTGQPELREKLKQHNLRQLKQRVALNCKMPPLRDVTEVGRYVRERLSIAGASQPDIFTPAAIDFIFQCSEGIPRQINNVCDNAMIAAYSSGTHMIGRSTVEEVAGELDLLPRNQTLVVGDQAKGRVPASRVITPEGFEELVRDRPAVSGDRDLDAIRQEPFSFDGSEQ